MSKVTVRDVAKAAGVSVATVSRVMNGATGVSPDLRERVLKAIKETHYVPNVAGRVLRQQRSSLIAVVTPEPENPYFMRLTAEVESVARRNGYGVLVAHSDHQVSREADALRQLAARQVAGAIVICADERHSNLSPLTDLEIPTVLIDRSPRSSVLDFVSTDNHLAGRLAAQHLSDQGYRQPVCICGPAHLSPTEDRTHGFLDAWPAGSGSDRPFVIRGDLRLNSGYEIAREVLKTRDVDSFYITNSPMTAGAFRAIKELKRFGLGLLGTDDDLWTTMVSPTVSVIEQPLLETGRRAAEILADRITNPDSPVARTLLAPRLIARESTSGPQRSACS